MQIQTVFKAGNSNVVTIPKSLSRQLGLKKGSRVVVELGADRKTLVITKTGYTHKVSSVTPNFVNTLDGVNKRYGPALAKLAKL